MVMDEKIAKVYQNLKQEGIDDVRAKDIIQKIEEYYDCLSDFNLEELDYIGALKAIQYGRFLKSNNASGENAKVWNDAKVYSDDNNVIWKPRNFQEASIIGIPQWCVSAQDYHWNNHLNSGDTIYMIYCGWESGNRQFVSACVERNGNIILYESGHDRIEGVEKEQYLKNLGNALSVLKPSNNRLNCLISRKS